MNTTRLTDKANKTDKAKTHRPPGRPRTSALTRQEQLRLAKRAQRARAKALGMETVALHLDQALAGMLKTAAQAPTFVDDLRTFLATTVVDIDANPALADIAWNRRHRWMPAEEAFALYERNWRFIDAKALQPSERQLINNLIARFGNGVLHA